MSLQYNTTISTYDVRRGYGTVIISGKSYKYDRTYFKSARSPKIGERVSVVVENGEVTSVVPLNNTTPRT